MRVTGISGRSRDRTCAVAEDLSGQLGHQVVPHETAESLLASGIGAVVIASPPAAHLESLHLALQAGVPCLCEKPLVAPHQLVAATELLDGFARRRLLLVENCQWPYVLPAFDALFPQAREWPVERIAMGMSPSAMGMEMIPDALPHVLSMVDALLPSASDIEIKQVQLCGQNETGFGERENLLQMKCQVEDRSLAVELHLRHVAEQPRPAWVAIDGLRMDRRIGPDYSIAFAAAAAAADADVAAAAAADADADADAAAAGDAAEGERVVAADDPLALLVDDFGRRLERFFADGAMDADFDLRLRRRWRWYGQVLGALGLPRAGDVSTSGGSPAT